MRMYTVKEIDQLRKVCEKVRIFGKGYYTGRKEELRPYVGFEDPHQRFRDIEEMVRTYVTAGVVAQDLLKEYNSSPVLSAMVLK